MLKKDNFFKNYFKNSSSYNNSLKKTNFFFNSLVLDIKKNKIPLLNSYEKIMIMIFQNLQLKNFSNIKTLLL